jgi:hypothetical protein
MIFVGTRYCHAPTGGDSQVGTASFSICARPEFGISQSALLYASQAVGALWLAYETKAS